MSQLRHLFTPVEVGNTVLPNRILSTAHQTNHVENGIPTSAMVAYHEARARGGAGLLILEATAVHESGMLTTKTIAGYRPAIVPAYQNIADAVHAHGTKVFSQLFHGGRELVSSSYRTVTWSASSEPSLRFGVTPREMTKDEIAQVIHGFATSARLAKDGGLDGVEVCCSHGYLPAQFWSDHVNHRTDEYGGSFENRMRFVVEVFEAIWREVGEDFTVGLRLSSTEMTSNGTTLVDAVEIVKYLVDSVRVDFVNVTAGDSSTYAGSTHIAPPSPMKHAYLSADAFKIRMAGAVPVFVGSRIVDPVEAEKIIAAGQADAVAMTRALIVDPDMPRKANAGEFQTINACLGCLQACIGHYHKGLIIGCIQNPVTGREETYRDLDSWQRTTRDVLVVGAGPGGLQAALTAQRLGHRVTLVDRSPSIGGMLNVMRRAPMRKEMAESMLDNYTRQLEASSVQVELGTEVNRDTLATRSVDAVIVASGSSPYRPHVPGIDDPRVVLVDKIFSTERPAIGGRVWVFDFLGDWAAIEAAVDLARKGNKVTLATARLYVGEFVHQYLRNEYLKVLYQLGVTLLPHMQWKGVDEDVLLVENLFTSEVMRTSEWDNVVVSMGRTPNTSLYDELKGWAAQIYRIGDCDAPRTIEEATYEGFLAALEVH